MPSTAFLLLCTTSAALSVVEPGTPISPDPSTLRIDPLLIVQAEEVWRRIAAKDNPIWPGWDATDTPILFYLPGIQDLLINHPNPPAGFEPYDGPVRFEGASMFVRNGVTHFDSDGQNTSTDLNEVRTLVVADTLSNRKPNITALMHDPRPVEERVESLTYDSLRSDPYEQMQMIAHEAFHVHQDLHSEGKHADESAVALYPTLSIENNAGFAMEGEWLEAALRAGSPADVREAALNWLAIRSHRRGLLAPEAVAYEDGNEFAEGLAKYIEWRLLNDLEGSEPGPRMHYAQGFAGYGDLQPQRDDLLKQIGMNLRGEINVNNDPYGAASLRFRLYFSGMAIAALLDRISDDWKARIFEPGTSLTSIAAAAIDASEGELARRFRRLTATDKYARFVTAKTALREAGLEHIQGMVEAIDEGSGTLLVIDFSAIEETQIRMGYTPFGVTRVDENSAIYRMVPIAARIRSTTVFRQTAPQPVLYDRRAKTFRFRLPNVTAEMILDALDMTALPIGVFDVPALQLPGVTVECGRAAIRQEDGAMIIRLEE